MKDYTLLRPFDLEKAKAGEAICSKVSNDEEQVEYLAGPDAKQIIAYMYKGNIFTADVAYFGMAPLAWVEDKPVYPGDRMYCQGESYEVAGRCEQYDGNLGQLLQVVGKGCKWANDLTWTPPRKTREVRLLGWLDGGNLILRNTDAPVCSDWLRVPGEDKTITVEEV